MPAASARRERSGRRRPARTGLLGASAAMAVGAVAMASGLIPSPGGLPGGYTFGGGDGSGNNLAQPDGPPATTAPVFASAIPAPTASSGAPAPATGGPRPSTSPSADRPTASPSPPPSTSAAASTPRAAPAATVTGSASSSADQAVATVGRQVLALVNAERAKAGCHPLTTDAKLTELAQDFSDEMAARGFFDHVDPDGRSPWDRATLLGITDLGGENIARGQADAQAVMDSWMNSPGHRANILDCQYRTLGVGVDFDSGGPWWTQDFGY